MYIITTYAVHTRILCELAYFAKEILPQAQHYATQQATVGGRLVGRQLGDDGVVGCKLQGIGRQKLLVCVVLGTNAQYGCCGNEVRYNQLTAVESMELRLNSPAGGDPAVYQWPLVAAVSRYVCAIAAVLQRNVWRFIEQRSVVSMRALCLMAVHRLSSAVIVTWYEC